MFKKTLSLLLCLTLCASCLPISAFAAEENGTDDALEAQIEEQLAGEESQPEPTPVVTPEPTVAPAPAAVRVSFNCTPAETLVWVYAAADEGTELEPEEDGSFLLTPGDYVYVAFCEGYVSAENMAFTVKEGTDPVEIPVVLEAEEPAESPKAPTAPDHDCEGELEQIELDEDEMGWRCPVCGALFDAEGNELPVISTLEDNIIASGTCGADGDNLTWTLDDAGLLTISGNGAMADMEYISEGSANQPWRNYTESIYSLIVEPGVTSIGSYAFYYCINLKSLTLNPGLISIGRSAFSVCKKLTKVIVPDSVTSIGSNAFYYCLELDSVKLPDGVTALGEGAFSRCSVLSEVNIPASVTRIEDRTFYYCNKLSQIIIPAGVTSIGVKAFEACTVMDSLTIPDKVTSIGDSAFYNCKSLTNVIISNGVTSIGEYAFDGCQSLPSVNIPASVTSIGNNAFTYCKSLTEICFEHTVDSPLTIGTNAFSQPGSSTTTVIVPDKANINPAISGYDWVGDNRAVTYENLFIASGSCGTSVTWTLDAQGVLTISGTGMMNGYYSNGGANTPWKDYLSSIKRVVVKPGVTTIGHGVFMYCRQLESIEIPESVTRIGGDAFYFCESLTSIDIPAGVTSIENDMFKFCESLTAINVDRDNASYSSFDGVLFNKEQTSLLRCPEGKSGVYTVPDGTISIADKAFYSVVNLDQIILSSDVSSIGAYAFAGSNVKNVTISDGVNSIGEQAFNSCMELEEIVVDESNANYCSFDGVLFSKDKNTLIKCPAAKSGEYTIPSGVVNIEKTAFQCCNKLTGLHLPDSVRNIGESAFYSCYSLESLLIPEGVTSIPYGMVSQCNGLKNVSIPSSVTSIGERAFMNCESLTQIKIPAGVTSLPEYALYGLSSLTEIVIPASVSYIGPKTFENCDKLASISFEHESADPLTIEASAFHLYSQLATTIFISDTENINPAIRDYDWAAHNRTVTYESMPVGPIDGTFNGSPAQVDSQGNLLINEVNFPDDNFRNFISTLFDTDNKGYLTEEKVSGVAGIQCSEKSISNLKGIEYFTALTSLLCQDNQLTSLDVSKNTALIELYCGFNQLSFLDVSKNTELTELRCFNNQLEALDISKNEALNYLNCSSNELTSLDVSKNTQLSILGCSHNHIAVLELARNTALTTLSCSLQSTSAEAYWNNCELFLDLGSIVGAENLSRISNVTGGSYDDSTGIVTLTAPEDGTTTVEVGYEYNTNAVVSPNTMTVSVTVTVPECNHVIVTDPAAAPTCTENGLTEGSHCSVCGEVIVAQEVVPATGHSFGEWTETKAPSLAEDGEETRTCQNPGCDVSETRAVKATIYTVSYDANGGSGAPAAQQKLKGTALTLSTTKPTLSGYTFKGWALTSTATTAAYAPGANYTEDADATLYAVWEKDVVVDENTTAITVSSVKAYPGSTVDVTVSLQNNSGIVGMTLKFAYDSSAMELTSITESGLEGTWIKSKGVTWANSLLTDNTYNGVILTLTFNVYDTATAGDYEVRVLYEEGDICNVNEEDVNFVSVPGKIAVKNRIPGDTNGDDKVNTKDFITLMKLLAGEDVSLVPGSADINGDGKVNTKDFIVLMKYLAGEDVTIH